MLPCLKIVSCKNSDISRKVFELFYTNTQGLSSSMNELDAYLIDKTYEVLCFTETWLRLPEAQSFKLLNYKPCASFNRVNLNGTMIMTRDEFLDFRELVNVKELS